MTNSKPLKISQKTSEKTIQNMSWRKAFQGKTKTSSNFLFFI